MTTIVSLREQVNDITRDPNNRKIPGYENYIISAEGDVYNTKYKCVVKHFESKCGYKYAKLRSNKKRSSCLIHRLVMLAFVGPSTLQVNHKDGNKLNNNLDNLEYCTCSENMKHSYKTGLRRPNNPGLGKTGALHVKSKAVIGISLFNGEHKYFDSIQTAERQTGINHSLICKVLKGKRKTTGGFNWKYATGQQ